MHHRNFSLYPIRRTRLMKFFLKVLLQANFLYSRQSPINSPLYLRLQRQQILLQHFVFKFQVLKSLVVAVLDHVLKLQHYSLLPGFCVRIDFANLPHQSIRHLNLRRRISPPRIDILHPLELCLQFLYLLIKLLNFNFRLSKPRFYFLLRVQFLISSDSLVCFEQADLFVFFFERVS